MRKKMVLLSMILIVVLVEFFWLRREIEPALPRIYFYENGNWQATAILKEDSKHNLVKTMFSLFQEKCKLSFPGLIFPVEPKISEEAIEIFVQGYQKLESLQRGIFESSISRSFFSLPQIEEIRLVEEGVRVFVLREVDGEKKVFLSAESMMENTVKENMLLYYYSPEKDILVANRKEIERPSYQSREEALLTALQMEPEDAQLQSLLSSRVKVLDIRIRNQVCYIDFSEEFADDFREMGAKKIFLLYSIVNTMTNDQRIEYVQILIEGENPDKYPDMDLLKGILRRNVLYIEGY